MRTSEVLIMILLGAGLFMATITVLYVVKVALSLLQSRATRSPKISPIPRLNPRSPHPFNTRPSGCSAPQRRSSTLDNGCQAV
jgi:hypothetical protein